MAVGSAVCGRLRRSSCFALRREPDSGSCNRSVEIRSDLALPLRNAFDEAWLASGRSCRFHDQLPMIVGGHSGAGRPILSWRWRLGPARFGSYGRGQARIRWRWRLGPARFGSYRKPHGGVGVLPYPTARAAFHASGLGGCDGRHRLLFECPIIFWTPCAPHAFFEQRAKCEVACTSLPVPL